MNKWKKAISFGMSAALVASLFTFIAAGTALASTTVTSAGNVARGGSSAGPATFLFTENSAAALTDAAIAADGSITVTILDSAGNPTVHFTGTGVLSAPGSLGASLTVGDNFFTVAVTDQDPLNVETISVTGLKISADTGAALGAVQANLTEAAQNVESAFVGGTVTATGTLANAYTAGATSVVVNVTSDCGFAVTGGSNGNLNFNNENKAITAVSGTTVQTLTIAATANDHAAGQTVSQTVANCSPTALASPAAVVDSAIYNPSTIFNVFPGENNQTAGNLSITERTAGYLSVGTTITFTIATAGVTFSNAPLASDNDGTFTFSGGALSADRKSVTWTVTTASAAPVTFTVSGIRYDVASSVPQGTNVSVGVALSNSLITVPTSRVNAIVGRIFNAAVASVPNVFIGQNAQATGLITLTEVGAGAFTDGTGSFNTFAVCVDEAGNDTYTSPGPWAKVTAGDLRLREGATASPDNIVQGTPFFIEGAPCYYWTVWTASTAASTIQIGNADFTSGALINVMPDDTPGPVVAGLYVGSVALDLFSLDVRVQVATRVFQNSVVVTALSQPIILAGSTDAHPGDIQIAETANGQLKAGEEICLEVLPRTSNNAIQDTFLRNLNTSDTPLVSATGGLVVGAVSLSNRFCEEQIGLAPIGPSGTHTVSFSFQILQQSTSGAGKLVISNMHFVTVADAPAGNVLMNVFGFGGSPTFVEFQATVSNAKIGSNLAGSAATRLGVTQTGAFTTSTKVQKVGKYVTYRFDFGVGAAGQKIDIWGATKTGNDWSAFAKATTRVANASGVVYYYVRQSSATWKSFRANYVSGGTWTAARQARWIP